MEIKGTAKIRGVLDLNSIRRQIKRDDVVPISEHDFWNADVQIAIKMGYLSSSGTQNTEFITKGESDRAVRVTNKLKTPLNLPGQVHAIPAGAQFVMKESELRNPDMRLAMTKGIIEVLGLLENKSATEGELSLFSEQPKEDSAPTISPIAKEPSKPKLDTNEELPELTAKQFNTTNVINTDNPAPIEPGDVPDPLGKSVIFNPSGAKPVKLVRNSAETDVSFVDEEDMQNRINKHPTMKKQSNNSELEFIDLDDVGTKRNPNLKPVSEEDQIE